MPGPTATAAVLLWHWKGHKAIVPVVAAETAGSNSPEWQVLLGNMEQDIVLVTPPALSSVRTRDTVVISVKIVKSEWSRPPPYIGNCRIERIIAHDRQQRAACGMSTYGAGEYHCDCRDCWRAPRPDTHFLLRDTARGP
jgi:hypothetical protein